MNAEGHCKDLLKTISDYLDGDVSEEICFELEKHLRECENCTIVVNTLRKTIELYHAEPASRDLPNDVRERLFAKLDLDPNSQFDHYPTS